MRGLCGTDQERANGLIMLNALPLFEARRADPAYQEIVDQRSLP